VEDSLWPSEIRKTLVSNIVEERFGSLKWREIQILIIAEKINVTYANKFMIYYGYKYNIRDSFINING